MLSEVEKELGRVRYKQERELFKTLDQYFEDPSDENLSTLQTMRGDHKETVEALDKERRRRLDAESMYAKGLISSASSIVATPPPFPAPTTPPAYTTAVADYEKRMAEYRKMTQERIDSLKERQDAAEAKWQADHPTPTRFWDRWFS